MACVKTGRVLMAGLAAGSAWGVAPALAQDSVSINLNGGNGLPGDALGPWSTTYQRASFVVDLSPITTSWGTPFAVAPIMKSGLANTARFNSRNGPSVISRDLRVGAAFPSATYQSWAQAGAGINLPQNNTGVTTPVTPTGSAVVQGVGFLDFDEVFVSSASVFTNHAIGGFVAYQPETPDRLYVTRIVAAGNSSAANQLDRSQFGLGSVDADGNLILRADGFGAASATGLLEGDNYFRVRLGTRNNTLNTLDNNGGSHAAATDWVMQRSTMTHAVPSALPASLASRSVLLGADFVGNLRSETSANTLTSLTTHRPNATDHRAAVSIYPGAILPGSAATGAILTRSTGGAGRTDSISVFGLSASGAVTSARTVTLPASIADACDAFAWPIAGGDFQHYDSQVTFRGGSGPAAVGRDGEGRAVVAAVLSAGTEGSPSNPTNAIVAARFDPASGTSPVSWTAVAWTDASAMTGKLVLGDVGPDGVPGTGDAGEGDGVIDAQDGSRGRLVALNQTALGGAGPSLSAPAIDAAGNVWFIGSALIKRQQGPSIAQVPTVGLFRAVLNPATFCYDLELVLAQGDVVAGRNSLRNWRVETLNLADSNSISSASIWPGSVSASAWNGLDPAGLDPAAPQTLGGLVLSARIVYDVNNDAAFLDPTAGTSTSVDEAYNVLLYVGNVTQPAACPCPADYNNSGSEIPDIDDLIAFFEDFNAGDSRADIDCTGAGSIPDIDDIVLFFEVFSNGCP